MEIHASSKNNLVIQTIPFIFFDDGECVCAWRRSISFLVPHSEEIALQMKLIHFLHTAVAGGVNEGCQSGDRSIFMC